jgi:hypothetical protein
MEHLVVRVRVAFGSPLSPMSVERRSRWLASEDHELGET